MINTKNMQVGEFRARCGERVEHPDQELLFDDRDEYAQHMTEAHGGRRWWQRSQQFKSVKAWKPPKRRKDVAPYAPTGTDPGAWITYSDGTRERRGQIWSQGPSGIGKSLWVVDEETGHAVLVQPDRVLTNCFSAVRTGVIDQSLTIRRIENLRRFGGLFPVIDEVVTRWHFDGGRRTKEEIRSWHVDPECPETKDKDRPETWSTWPSLDTRSVIRGLLDGSLVGDTRRLCRRCFWLNPDSETAT
jgi:hypothetical protein